MNEFGGRANINHYSVETYCGRKDVLIYDDHRTLFSILFSIQKHKLIEGLPNLIYFDQHDDAVTPLMSIEERLSSLNNGDIDKLADKRVWTYGEFELGIMDDDWLCAAMDLNLIKDAFLIGGRTNLNTGDIDARYNDEKDQHRLYDIEHLHVALNNRGILEDNFYHEAPEDDVEYIRSIFGVKGKQMDSTPFVLDFDLDCFATECEGQTMAWSEQVFIERFCHNLKVFELMQKLLAHCSLITICREPSCCGGIGESNKILQYLDKYFFDYALKTFSIS